MQNNNNIDVRQLIMYSIQLCAEACRNIKIFHEEQNFNKYHKNAGELVTDVDFKIQKLLIKGLLIKFPKLKIIGQESKDPEQQINFDYATLRDDILTEDIKIYQKLPLDKVCLWIDPIDSTKGLVNGHIDNVSTMIGLSYNNRAVVGIIGVPYKQVQPKKFIYEPQIFFGSVHSRKAYYLRNQKFIQLEINPLKINQQAKILTRPLKMPFFMKIVKQMKAKNIIMGGAGKKIMQLAKNKYDLVFYPKNGTSKWDSCGPQAIIKAMGGFLTDLNRKKLAYDPQKDTENQQAIVCALHEHFYQQFLNQYQKIDLQ